MAAQAASCRVATRPAYQIGARRCAEMSPNHKGTTVDAENPMEFAAANLTKAKRVN